MVAADCETFYRTMADELSDLSRLTAVLTWTPDGLPTARRKQTERTKFADTGRMPSRTVHNGDRLKSVQNRAPPIRKLVKSEDPEETVTKKFPVEVSSKKPPHLEQVKTKPVPTLLRRGSQPRNQAVQSTKPRRLVLGEGIRSASETLSRALRAGTGQTSPYLLAEVAGQRKDLADAAVQVALAPHSEDVNSVQMAARSTTAVETSPLSRPTSEKSYPKVSPVASPRRRFSPVESPSNFSALHRSVSESSAASFRSNSGSKERDAQISGLTDDKQVNHDDAGDIQPAPTKARLVQVFDLQMLLPDNFAQAAAESHFSNLPSASKETQFDSVEVQKTTEQHGRRSNVEHDEQHDEGVGKQAQPDLLQRARSPVRPVVRGLIADVISELATPSFQAAAEVTGGIELGLLHSLSKSSRKAVQAKGNTGSTFEDVHGRRLFAPPPPFEAGPPPPYDIKEATLAEERLRRERDAHREQLAEQRRARDEASAALEAARRTAAEVERMNLFKAEIEAKVTAETLDRTQQLLQVQAQTHREDSLLILRAVQQQAESAHHHLSELAQHQVLSLQQSASLLQEKADALAAKELNHRESGPLVPAPSPHASLSPEVTATLMSMKEAVGRLEAQLDRQLAETTRNLALQSEERAAYISALADARGPFQVLPFAVPPSEPPTTRHAQQTTQASMPAASSASSAVAPTHHIPSADCFPASASTAKKAIADAIVQTMEQPTITESSLGKDHKARVARFTNFLLHGPPGDKQASSFQTPTRFAYPPTPGAEALLAITLRRPKQEKSANLSPPGPSTETSEDDNARVSIMHSPGEVFSLPCLPAAGKGFTVGVSSPGEIRSAASKTTLQQTIHRQRSSSSTSSLTGSIGELSAKRPTNVDNQSFSFGLYLPEGRTNEAVSKSLGEEPGELGDLGASASLGEESDGEEAMQSSSQEAGEIGETSSGEVAEAAK